MNSRVRSTPARGRGSSRLLGLEVVEDQRQVAVGAHDLGDVRGDDLLVRHREHQLGALAVLELEQLVDVVAARCAATAPPGCSTGISISWPPIASISSRTICTTLLVHAPAGGQPGPQAGADLADQPRADHAACARAPRRRRAACFSVGRR